MNQIFQVSNIKLQSNILRIKHHRRSMTFYYFLQRLNILLILMEYVFQRYIIVVFTAMQTKNDDIKDKK